MLDILQIRISMTASKAFCKKCTKFSQYMWYYVLPLFYVQFSDYECTVIQWIIHVQTTFTSFNDYK